MKVYTTALDDKHARKILLDHSLQRVINNALQVASKSKSAEAYELLDDLELLKPILLQLWADAQESLGIHYMCSGGNKIGFMLRDAAELRSTDTIIYALFKGDQ